MKFYQTILLAAAISIPSAAEACTNFIAGKKATVDGSIMVT